MQINKGSRIEVKRTQGCEAVNGPITWFPATVLQPQEGNWEDSEVYVEYETLLDTKKEESKNNSKRMREYIRVVQVRPVPPMELHRFSKIGEKVEAFCAARKGWRKGWVVDILENSRYTVSFCSSSSTSINGDANYNEELVELEQWELRAYRDWDGGSRTWIPSAPPSLLAQHNQQENKQLESEVKASNIKLKIKCKRTPLETKYSEGLVVEVKPVEGGPQNSFYTARILGSSRDNKFLVEYLTLVTEDKTEKLTEEVNISSIRPCLPKIQQVEPFRLLEQVDAWYNGGWWIGHISKVTCDWKYLVCLRSTNEEKEFEHSELRPHKEWTDGRWMATPTNSDPLDLGSRNLKLKVRCSRRASELKFPAGMIVEVKSDEEGYQGSWYTAVIIGAKGSHQYLVEYQTLKTEDEIEYLQEKIDASYIRPCPPKIQLKQSFKLLEEVDAWYNDGWWIGLIHRVFDNGKYAVYFWTTNEELDFERSHLRPHQEWIDGEWVSSFRKNLNLLMKLKLGECVDENGVVSFPVCFGSGVKVEVRSDVEGYTGFWYPAEILKPIGNIRYLVEYVTVKTDDENGLLKEEAHALCIRPSPPVVQRVGRFRPLEEVDAWYSDGWWAGQVSEVLKGYIYRVCIRTTNEVLEFRHFQSRPHQEWIGGEWVSMIRV